MAGIALLVLGAALAGWGTRAATVAARPVDLVGALAAPVGVVLMLVGAVSLAVPGFLG